MAILHLAPTAGMVIHLTQCSYRLADRLPVGSLVIRTFLILFVENTPVHIEQLRLRLQLLQLQLQHQLQVRRPQRGAGMKLRGV